MENTNAWVTDANLALLTDLYELTMVQAYWHEGMTADAVFSLYYRELPAERNYILACGNDDVLGMLERLRFGDRALKYLSQLGDFDGHFLDWLADFRFAGDVFAVPEGTPVFPQEPLLEVRAPIAQAQLAESLIMNQIHFQSVVASKAARIVAAAAGVPVIDFGLRRIHGADAALKAARAYHVAGLAATSNVLAGYHYGVPVTGTMAHSYIQAHDDEAGAFAAFAGLYPETVLLVDTYDTPAGVDKVVALARELGDDFRVRGIRIDSGDLGPLAADARQRLDAAGLDGVKIFVSGGLDEWSIAELVAGGNPIDGYGVGTSMGVARGGSSLDMAYKLVQYGGEGRLKLSSGKRILPGRKQIFRRHEDGVAAGDVLASATEEHPGEPLLQPVMRGGERLDGGRIQLDAAREHARRSVAALPERVRRIEPAEPPYPVRVSKGLAALQERVSARVRQRVAPE